MTHLTSLAILAALGTLAACAPVPADKAFDRGINAHPLSNMTPGIWIDPEGCDHWIIDDGLEGYMSERLTPDGLPVCSGVAAPETTAGPFKSGSPVPDLL